MKKILLIILLSLSAVAGRAQTADADLGAAVLQLETNGPGSFAKVLYDVDSESAKQLADRLTSITRDAGPAVGYEIMSRRFITQKVQRLILALYFDRRPIYMRVDTYDSPKGRIFLPALVSREAIDVVPLDVINTSGK